MVTLAVDCATNESVCSPTRAGRSARHPGEPTSNGWGLRTARPPRSTSTEHERRRQQVDRAAPPQEVVVPDPAAPARIPRTRAPATASTTIALVVQP